MNEPVEPRQPGLESPRFGLARGVVGTLAVVAAGLALSWSRGWRIRAFLPFWRDFDSYFLPKYEYAAERIAAGDLPLWNPLEFGGIPFLATLQPAVLYPPLRALFLVFEGEQALYGFVLLHLLIGALGTLLFVRSLGAGALAAVFAVAWVVEPLQLVRLYDHPPFLAGVSWLPWVLFFLRELLFEGSRRAAVGLGVVSSFVLLAGYPFFVIAIAYLSLLWVFDWAWASKPDRAGSARGGRLLLFASGLALLLSAAQTLPTVELVLAGSRTSIVLEATSAVDRIAEQQGPGFLALHGYPTVTFEAQARFAFDRFGPVLLFLGSILVLLRPRWPATWALVASFLLSALMPGWVYRGLPFSSFVRFFFEWSVIASFTAFVLAALGLDALYRLAPVSRRSPVVLAGAGLALLGFTFWWNSRLVQPSWYEGARIPHSVFPAVAEQACGFRDPTFRSLWPGGQIAGASIRERMPSITGYEQSLLPSRTRQLSERIGLGNGAFFPGWRRGLVENHRLLSRLGLRCLIAPHSPALEAVGFREVGHLAGGNRVYLNPAARPRARVESNPRGVQTPEEAFALLENGGEERTIVEGWVGPSEPCHSAREPSVRWLRDDPEHIALEVHSECPALLVLADTWTGDWEATVDGEAREILVADYAFRAVPLDAGDRRVVFRYDPDGFRLGWWLSLVGLLAAAVGLRPSIAAVGSTRQPPG